MKDIYIVAVDRVPGVTRPQMLKYIRDAIVGWSGGFDAQDQTQGALMEATHRKGFLKIWAEARPDAPQGYHPCNQLELMRKWLPKSQRQG